ncbi:MAG: glycosyltransferase, partial [Patescibacteria group bacterium]|nr:glycosyltransferase [Patescibacteria group bacterium]
MKVSVVITVKNEADTIESLLQSLRAQTKKPDEIIVVDAGSTDDTSKIVKRYSITYRVCDRGTNRAKGRNFGIRASRNKIIAVTDAGCRADQHWLERLTKPFKDKQVLSVAG